MNRIATLAADERQLIISQVSVRNGVPAVMLEKDFWVCWMLGLLFEPGSASAAYGLVFKGGTSLSKVFGVIERFSEDLDLSVPPGLLDISDEEIRGAVSNRANKRLLADLETRCCEWVRNTVNKGLEQRVAAVLGARRTGPWLEYLRDGATQSPTLLFHYPTAQQDGSTYIRRAVKLEFGSLTDQQPTGLHLVRPWLTAALEDTPLRDAGCEVTALGIERTAWEKATILHALHHRPLERPLPDRYSRHYADLAALAGNAAARAALADHDLRRRVVDWKARFFASATAAYDQAQPPTFRLVPPAERLPELQQDYRQMQEMFLKPPPPLEKVMEVLNELESEINGIAIAQPPSANAWT